MKKLRCVAEGNGDLRAIDRFTSADINVVSFSDIGAFTWNCEGGAVNRSVTSVTKDLNTLCGMQYKLGDVAVRDTERGTVNGITSKNIRKLCLTTSRTITANSEMRASGRGKTMCTVHHSGFIGDQNYRCSV
jgi:hypothetical protein